MVPVEGKTGSPVKLRVGHLSSEPTNIVGVYVIGISRFLVRITIGCSLEVEGVDGYGSRADGEQ